MIEPANFSEPSEQLPAQRHQDQTDAFSADRLLAWAPPQQQKPDATPTDRGQQVRAGEDKPATKEEPVKDNKIVLPPLSRTLGEAKEYKGFMFGGSTKERIDALRQTKFNVDYKLIIPKDSKVTVFGETHPVSELREELVANMKQFKEMGFTYLAMEALESKYQPLLDEYYAGKPGADKAALTKALDVDWGWDTEGYVELINAAKANGIKIICLDKTISKEQKEEWKKAGLYGKQTQVREEQWAQIVDATMKNDPNARILLLAGKAHVGNYPERDDNLVGRLIKSKLNPRVVELTATEHESMGSAFESAVGEAGLAKERFAVPVVQDGFRPADVIINLPARPGSNTAKDPTRIFLEALKKMKPPAGDPFDSLPDPVFPDIKFDPPPIKFDLPPLRFDPFQPMPRRPFPEAPPPVPPKIPLGPENVPKPKQ